MSIDHGVMLPGVIHVPHNWEFADRVARIASSQSDPGDVGKIALQLDDGSYWRLIAVAPAAWARAMSRRVVERQEADFTAWVRSDGSNGHDGTANTPEAAWATLQYAMNEAAARVLDGARVQINLGLAGAYAGFALVGNAAGHPTADGTYLQPITLTGLDATTRLVHNPDIGGGGTVQAFGARIRVETLRVESSAGNGLLSAEAGVIEVGGGTVFGDCLGGGNHIYAIEGGVVYYFEDTTIAGAASQHLSAAAGHGWIEGGGNTVTIQGNPHFVNGFVGLGDHSAISLPGVTFVGGATGPRFLLQGGSSIFTGTNDATYFPGDLDGVFGVGGGSYDNLSLPTPPLTYAQLVGARTNFRGARAYVTDLTLAPAGNFGAIAAGGGGFAGPVYCDGVNWRIG